MYDSVLHNDYRCQPQIAATAQSATCLPPPEGGGLRSGAVHKMRQKLPALGAAVLLGIFWGVWHMPVIDYLGTATPHGAYWLPFFLSFTAAMTAMRVLIAWLYSNTTSVLLGQLMHVSSTGSLVIFSPPHVSAAQEVFWYAVYAAALWIAVALLALVYGTKNLRSVQT